jgi:hypothetical protein
VTSQDFVRRPGDRMTGPLSTTSLEVEDQAGPSNRLVVAKSIGVQKAIKFLKWLPGPSPSAPFTFEVGPSARFRVVDHGGSNQRVVLADENGEHVPQSKLVWDTVSALPMPAEREVWAILGSDWYSYYPYQQRDAATALVRGQNGAVSYANLFPVPTSYPDADRYPRLRFACWHRARQEWYSIRGDGPINLYRSGSADYPADVADHTLVYPNIYLDSAGGYAAEAYMAQAPDGGVFVVGQFLFLWVKADGSIYSRTLAVRPGRVYSMRGSTDIFLVSPNDQYNGGIPCYRLASPYDGTLEAITVPPAFPPSHPEYADKPLAPSQHAISGIFKSLTDNTVYAIVGYVRRGPGSGNNIEIWSLPPGGTQWQFFLDPTIPGQYFDGMSAYTTCLGYSKGVVWWTGFSTTSGYTLDVWAWRIGETHVDNWERFPDLNATVTEVILPHPLANGTFIMSGLSPQVGAGEWDRYSVLERTYSDAGLTFSSHPDDTTTVFTNDANNQGQRPALYWGVVRDDTDWGVSSNPPKDKLVIGPNADLQVLDHAGVGQRLLSSTSEGIETPVADAKWNGNDIAIKGIALTAHARRYAMVIS